MKRQYLNLLLLALLCGCLTAQPKVWVEKGVSLAHYKIFEVPPAQNDTGKTFEVDIAAMLTVNITSQLRAKGYTVSTATVSGGDVVIVKSSIIVYDPGYALARWLVPGAGENRITVRTSLIEKITQKLLADMITSTAVQVGGLIGMLQDKQLLETVAAGIVDELDQRIKQEQSKTTQ